MRKKIRVSSILVLSLFLTLLLSACGQKQSNNQTIKETNKGEIVEESEKKETKTLDFVWFSDGVEGDVTKEIIKDYQAENPHIQFNIIEIPYKDLETKLKVMVSGGEPPALARITNVQTFKPSLVDLNEYISNPGEFKDQFSDSLENYYVYDNKMLAAPIDVTANGLIYNKTAFEKAGVTVPTSPEDVWTWDEWVDAMKQVMEKGGVNYGLVYDKSPHRFSTLLYQAGGSMLGEDGKTVTINNPEAVEAVEFFKKLHDEKIIPDSVWVGSENPNNLFRTGQVGMHFAGSWMMTNYRDNIEDFEWGVTYMPKGKIRSSVPGGKYIAAFKGSGVEKEAADFIEYFTSKEVNAKYAMESLFMSPRKDNASLDYPFAKEYFEIFADELNATPNNASRDWSHPTLSASIQNDLRDGIVEVIAGNETAQEMLDKIAEQAKEAVDRE